MIANTAQADYYGLSSRFFSIFIGAKRLIQTQVLLNFIF